MHFGESVGRLSGLMPPNKPSVREAAQAKATLLDIAMYTINRRFYPTLTSGRGGQRPAKQMPDAPNPDATNPAVSLYFRPVIVSFSIDES